MLKFPVDKEILDLFSTNGDGLLYIPIVKSQEEAETVLSYPSIQTIGLELIVPNNQSDLADEKWQETVWEKNLLTVINAENLGIGFNLFQQMNDDTALFHESK